MAKRCLFLESTTLNRKDPKKDEIDWSKCILCNDNERTGDDKLTIPDDKVSNSGYTTLAKTLEELVELGELPPKIDLNNINDGSGIEQTLKKNRAGFHKFCKLDHTKILKRAKKRKQKKSMDDSIENCSPVKTRRVVDKN